MKSILSKLKQVDFCTWPLLLIIMVTPLFIRLEKVISTPLEKATYYRENFIDLFAFARGNFFVMLTIIAGIAFVISLLTKDMKLMRDRILLVPAGLMLLTALSYFNALDRVVALRGSLDHYEGIKVLVAYSVAFIIAYHVGQNRIQSESLTKGFVASSVICLMIGFLQAFNINLLNSSIYKYFAIGPENYGKLEKIALDGTSVFSVFSNPNYIGNYTVLLVPVALYYYMRAGRTGKWLYGFVISLAIAVTYLAHSLGGIISVSAALLICYCLMGKGSISERLQFAYPVAAGYGVAVAALIYQRLVEAEAVISILGVLLIVLCAEIWGKLTRNNIRMRAVGVVAVLMILVVMGVWSFSAAKPAYETGFYVKNITTQDPELRIDFMYQGSPHVARFQYIGTALTMDLDGVKKTYDQDTEETFSGKPEYKDLSFLFAKFEKYNVLRFQSLSIQFFVLEEGCRLIDVDKKSVEIQHPAYLPIDGFERAGNGRAYIWSRSVPLVGKYLLIGAGPDNFPFVFPQKDLVGKLNAGSPSMTIDKPHNWYLQSAINTGGLSVVLILGLFSVFAVRAIRRFRNAEVTLLHAMFSAIVAYHLIQLFNDSTLATAPLFWILYGIAYGVERNESRTN